MDDQKVSKFLYNIECIFCGREVGTDISPQEALAELRKQHPDATEDQCGMVCPTCEHDEDAKEIMISRVEITKN